MWGSPISVSRILERNPVEIKTPFLCCRVGFCWDDSFYSAYCKSRILRSGRAGGLFLSSLFSIQLTVMSYPSAHAAGHPISVRTEMGERTARGEPLIRTRPKGCPPLDSPCCWIRSGRMKYSTYNVQVFIKPLSIGFQGLCPWSLRKGLVRGTHRKGSP